MKYFQLLWVFSFLFQNQKRQRTKPHNPPIQTDANCNFETAACMANTRTMFTESMVANRENKDNNIAYFNNAGQARLSARAVDVGVDCVQRQPWQQHADEQRTIRQLYAQLIHADAADIAIMPSTAFCLSLAARNIERTIPSGGRILLLQDQFCSAVYPWQDLCDRSKDQKWQLEIVQYPTEESNWTDEILSHLTGSCCETIRVVCLPPLHWSDGAAIDLPRISRICQSKKILLLVDATQAVGAMPRCDLKNIVQPALLCCSVHKWLRGPPGSCLVYISTDLHDTWEPLDDHGRSRVVGKYWEVARNEMAPSGYPSGFVSDARKFDSGGKPNPILLPILRAGLEDVVQLDRVAFQDQLKQLMQPLLEWAADEGLLVHQKSIFTESGGSTTTQRSVYHLIGLRPKNKSTAEMMEIARQLAAQNIFVAVRCGNFRISPYLDNTRQDVERLVNALGELLK